MAKKSKKNKRASSNPADGLRDAVERTWQGAGGAQKRVTEVFDDFGAALVRLRETLDEKRVLDTLEGLRDEVTGLARRVANLEGGRGASKPAASKRAAKRKPAARKSAAKRKPAARKTAARKTAASKPAARKSAPSTKPAAKKPAAKKPAAKPSASSSS